ncbi:MAG TPA: acyloxyacyl hydrolase [Vicinamibacterales bacterium]|nr:acyloxyacyl hydrolase [Vicinamibacterales bacterium]
MFTVLALTAVPAAAQSPSSEAGSLDPTTQRIDALGSEPSPKGQWRLGAFVGAAHNSPINPLLGQTPGRDHYVLGLQAQTTVLKVGGARLSYGVQVVPAMIVRGRSLPVYYVPPDDPEFSTDDTAYAFGVSPFAIELAVPVASRVAFYGAAAGGLIFFNKPFPVPEAKSSNFTIEYGGGVLVRIGRRAWIQAGYKYHHLSNAYRELVNPGLDAHMFYVGFWRGL